MGIVSKIMIGITQNFSPVIHSTRKFVVVDDCNFKGGIQNQYLKIPLDTLSVHENVYLTASVPAS